MKQLIKLFVFVLLPLLSVGQDSIQKSTLYVGASVQTSFSKNPLVHYQPSLGIRVWNSLEGYVSFGYLSVPASRLKFQPSTPFGYWNVSLGTAYYLRAKAQKAKWFRPGIQFDVQFPFKSKATQEDQFDFWGFRKMSLNIENSSFIKVPITLAAKSVLAFAFKNFTIETGFGCRRYVVQFSSDWIERYSRSKYLIEYSLNVKLPIGN